MTTDNKALADRLLELAAEIERQARDCPTVDWRPNAFENAHNLRAIANRLSATPQPQGDASPEVREALAAIQRAAARTPHREDTLALYAAHATLSHQPAATPQVSGGGEFASEMKAYSVDSVPALVRELLTDNTKLRAKLLAATPEQPLPTSAPRGG